MDSVWQWFFNKRKNTSNLVGPLRQAMSHLVLELKQLSSEVD